MNCNTSSPTNNQSSKYNLIQNFYIIGFSPDDFFKVNPKEKTGEFADIFNEKLEDMPNLTPKIITKFPNIKNSINSISDELVLDHCFPDKIMKIIEKSKGEENPKSFFQFELENIPQNYDDEEKTIYSKIYFSCLEINEAISEYFQYKKEIINLIFKYKSIKIINFDKNVPQGIDIEKKYTKFMIPKILCFASVLPFYNELGTLLNYIYDYYLTRKGFDYAPLPLEKLIEKIILRTPIPIAIGEELTINFQTSKFKGKIQFPLCNMNELNINYSADMSLEDIFKYFTIEDIIKIFRYILYEIPILFFSDNKLILSLFIDIFLTVLSPFKYVFPHISILPKKLYGLINSEQQFIFGINQTYNENFFTNNNIELDKTIVIISIDIDQSKNTANIKIDEKIYDNKNMEKLIIERKGLFTRYEEYITLNDIKMHILSVDFPNAFKKFLFEGMYKYLSFTRKKNFFQKKESPPKDLTFKIQNAFYKFFVNILSGYTEFFLKPPSLYNNPKNIGEKVFFKKNNTFLKEVFNYDEFIAKAPKDYQAFYKIFFKTKLFLRFFHERIYNNNNIEQCALRQFDQLTYLKKHSEMRKRKENKNLYENFKKDVIEKIKIENKNEIIIADNFSFSNKEVLSLVTEEEKITDILLQYGQLINIKAPKNAKGNEKNEKEGNYSKLIEINYCIFPKLLNEYLDKNNTNLIFLKNCSISNFVSTCKVKKEVYDKDRPYVYNFFEKLADKIVSKNIPNKNYEVSHDNYINYIWLILLSCSIWYCEAKERVYRLEKLFETLNEMEYIEEYVLNILYINLYKSGDTLYFIKMYFTYIKYVGYINYYFLYLLCDQIRKKGNNINELLQNDKMIDEEEENDLFLSTRYLIKLSSEFTKKRKNILTRSSVLSEDVEQILFSTEQTCKKCKEVDDIKPLEIIKTKINLDEEKYKYKCPKCQNEQEIIIKYQILLFNYYKKEAFINEKGEFIFLTPYKLYKDLKKYLIEENITQLDIKNIFDFKEEINLINILFYFSLLDMSYDFLLPYVVKLSSSMRLFFEKSEPKEKEKVKLSSVKTLAKPLEKTIKAPIRINYKDEVSFVFRKFNNIVPKYNTKAKNKFFLFEYGERYVESDLSFTIKNSKGKKK